MNGLMSGTRASLLFFGFVLLLLFPVFLLVCPSQVSATLLTYTDAGTYAPSQGGNDITYSLDYSLQSGSTYDALFTVETSANVDPEWRLGWVAFKFGPDGSSFEIDNLVASDGNWAVGETTTSFGVGASTPFATEFNGFYATDLTGSALYGGLSLTDGPSIYTFSFTFEGDGPVFNSAMPLKAGFFGEAAGRSGKAQFDQLSENAVPEPATMFLLGSGLIGLAGFGRRKFGKG